MTGSNNQEVDWISVTTLIPDAKTNPGILRNWALVLSARGIPYRAEPQKRPRDLFIPENYCPVALHEISLYRNENVVETRTVTPLEKSNNILTSLSVLMIVGVFHNLTYLKISGFGHSSIDWLLLGSANNSLILDGEWWRLATALTLHADGQHLLGNLLLGGYFVIRLCQITGSGLGWALVLSSGIIGNLANAFFQTAGHNSVGASTAIFGAIGIAGAIGSMLSPRQLVRQWVLPLAAAAMLLAFFGGGTDGRTDVAAHCFGFVAGILLGIPVGYYLKKEGVPKRAGNLAFAAISVLVIAASWLAALIS